MANSVPSGVRRIFTLLVDAPSETMLGPSAGSNARMSPPATSATAWMLNTADATVSAVSIERFMIAPLGALRSRQTCRLFRAQTGAPGSQVSPAERGHELETDGRQWSSTWGARNVTQFTFFRRSR